MLNSLGEEEERESVDKLNKKAKDKSKGATNDKFSHLDYAGGLCHIATANVET